MKRYFFSQTAIELAERFYNEGDNLFALIDCLLEDGFPDGHHRNDSFIGHLRSHMEHLPWVFCPIADCIRSGMVGALYQFSDIQYKLEEFQKNS